MLSTTPDLFLSLLRNSAVKDPRAVKKALQALGRRRPDLIWKLPPGPLNELAGPTCPHPARNIRKNVASFERVKDYAGLEAARSRASEKEEGAGGMPTHEASTQDVLRVLWSWVQANPVSDGEEAGLEGPLGEQGARMCVNGWACRRVGRQHKGQGL
jgi:hypothetical protein